MPVVGGEALPGLAEDESSLLVSVHIAEDITLDVR